jgi:hypothetical protein
VQARRIRGSEFFTFRQPDVVLVGVQDPVILHSEDDSMQYIVIIGRSDELMPTLAIQPSPWILIPKTAHLDAIWLHLSHFREILSGPTIEIAKRNTRSKSCKHIDVFSPSP